MAKNVRHLPIPWPRPKDEAPAFDDCWFETGMAAMSSAEPEPSSPLVDAFNAAFPAPELHVTPRQPSFEDQAAAYNQRVVQSGRLARLELWQFAPGGHA